MPTYRIYYFERQLTGVRPRDYLEHLGWDRIEPEAEIPQGTETEWEEDIEAEDERDALRIFFRDHLKDEADLGYLDERGEPQRPWRLDDLDPERTYLWVEGDKLMQYQGIESLANLVACPLCGGSGRVSPDVAEEFAEEEEEL